MPRSTNQQTLTVVKVGGKLINDHAALAAFLSAFAALPGHKLLVHGGGRSATSFAERLGLETKMVDGRRITGAATLEVAVMTYAGAVNKDIVARLQGLRQNAVGLSGADLDAVRSVKRPVREIDYGLVGDVVDVNAEGLNGLVQLGVVSVMCPITHDGAGQLLNTNADTIAARVAAAMSAYFKVKLHYCFEFDGVLEDVSDPSRTVPQIRVDEVSELRISGKIHAGMLPKLDNAAYAKTHGVSEVSICGVNNLASQTGATWIR